jgi:hypothetical protein
MSTWVPHAAPGTSGRDVLGDELLSIEEAIARYPDQWVLMKVIDRDNRHQPARGYVLAHSFDEKDVNAVLAREPPLVALPPEKRTHSYYVFNAYPRVTSGPA